MIANSLLEMVVETAEPSVCLYSAWFSYAFKRTFSFAFHPVLLDPGYSCHMTMMLPSQNPLRCWHDTGALKGTNLFIGLSDVNYILKAYDENSCFRYTKSINKYNCLRDAIKTLPHARSIILGLTHRFVLLIRLDIPKFVGEKRNGILDLTEITYFVYIASIAIKMNKVYMVSVCKWTVEIK